MNDEKKLVYEDDFVKNFQSDMACVHSCIKDAAVHGLEVEVVTFALLAMQADPTLSVSDAIISGYNEWVK